MGTPYQCLKSCGQVLLAARGSSIDLFHLEDGLLLSTWTFPAAQDVKPPTDPNGKGPVDLEPHKSESSIDVVLESSLPAKRRKLSEVSGGGSVQLLNGKSHSKKEADTAKKENKRSEAVFSGLETLAVIALAVTVDGRHVIAVTGEDKSIRVLENTVDETGKGCIKQLSQRAMPKRPCAIAVTPDNSTIISADKFGDVYALPLLVLETPSTLKPTAPTPGPTSSKTFISAANHLTVHSQRNRKALENQQKQSNKPTEKTDPTFEHKLLLGHVSMLTDLALVTSAAGRNYILTADRDEHIRVSRSISQAHVIEGFCLGHTEFISRLRIPKERPDVLISGGGDDEIFVWDWLAGSLIGRADLRKHVKLVFQELQEQESKKDNVEPLKVAVSSITHVRQSGGDGVEDLIIVSCEGIPALFTFLLTTQKRLEFIQIARVPGNVIGVAADATDRIVISIDTIHKPGSTTDKREASAGNIASLQKFVFENRNLVPTTTVFQTPEEEVKERGQSVNLFYNLEQLRKRDSGREEE